MIRLSQRDLQTPEGMNYPNAGSVVDGRDVIDDIPNLSSISSSLTDYTVLKDIREVPVSDLISNIRDYFYASDDFRQVEYLAEQIKESKQIKPVIVVIQNNEVPYVLEGGHRVAALFPICITA